MRTPYIRSQHLLAVAGLAFLAGCGGGEPTPAPEEPAAETSEASVDVCALLTAADIEEALGKSAPEPMTGEEGLGQCTWGGDVNLVLEEADLDSFDEFVLEFGEEFGGENPPRDRFHPVEGLGDWAMYRADDDMVRVFVGERVLNVSAEGAEEAQLADLAGRATARLR